MESPEALFAPDHLISTSVPAPLLLLTCMRLPLETAYDRTDAGLISKIEHRYQRTEIVHPDGSRFTTEVHGSHSEGLPSVYDLDYLLGILRLIESRGIEPDGRIPKVNFRALLDATRPGTGDNTPSTRIDAVKRALRRWGATTIVTDLRMRFPEEAARVRSSTSAPAAPVGVPDRLERAESFWVLQYQYEAEVRGSRSSVTLDTLRINPDWVDQSTAGFAAWIDIDAHNSLRSGLAKAIYLRLALQAAQGALPMTLVEPLSTWHEHLGLPETRSERPSVLAARFAKALQELQQHDVLEFAEVQNIGRGAYEARLTPGPVVVGVAHARGIGAQDLTRTRVLMSHLAQYGVPEGERRLILSRYGSRVQDVLRRVHYQRTVKQGLDATGRPVRLWRAWIASALESGWEFSEPEYLAWLKERDMKHLSPSPPRLSPAVELDRGGTPASESESAAPPASRKWTPPDDVWGEVLTRVREELPEQTFQTWLVPTWLVEDTGEEITVGTPNPFGAQWISDKHGDTIGGILAELRGRAVRLRVITAQEPVVSR
jgi:hypothetical protein